MTIKCYLLNSEITGKAKITALHNGEKPIIRLDRTWFHPQGGGQKADRGTIEGIFVSHVAHNDGEVDHYVETIEPFFIEQEVSIIVDTEWRLSNAKHHTAGHLIAALMEERFPNLQAISGHHWVNEARVEFTGEFPDIDRVEETLNAALEQAIAADLPIYISGNPLQNRSIGIGGYPAVPCGGTHLESLAILDRVELTKLKIQKGKLRISYAV
jgi:alanyl-tRNA synthetase